MFDEFVHSSARSSGLASPSIAGPSRGGGTEGAATVSAAAAAGYASNGFEQGGPSRHSHDLDPVTALETGFNSAEESNAALGPIFQLGRVQYAFPAPLALLTVSSNILTMCLYAYPQSGILPQNLPPPPRLVRINLDQPERTEEAEVPLPPLARNRAALPTDPSLLGPHKMFADPTGQHLVLAMRNGENYYWRSGWKKARALSKWKGLVVESIAWSRQAAATVSRKSTSAQYSTTKEILVGTKQGDICEAVLTAPLEGEDGEGDFIDRIARRTAGAGSLGLDVDRVLRPVFSLSERQPVTGLLVVPIEASRTASYVSHKSKTGSPSDSSSPRPRTAVIATTSTRIYEFIGTLGGGGQRRGDETDGGAGGESVYSRLFDAYRGSVPNLKSELPGDIPHSELRYFVSSEGKTTPKALAWLTGSGIYHGHINSASAQEGTTSVIESANLLPYPHVSQGRDSEDAAGAKVPLGLLLSEFHFLLLHKNRTMAISSLDDSVVFEESLPLKPNERVIGTTVDTTRKTYWIYTDANIFEVVVKDEDRSVWKVYMERGMHEAALKHVKAASQRDMVLSAQGDRFFKEGRHIQAAQCYAQSFTRTFEQVVLRFLDANAKDALRYYLVTRLERLKKVDVTQRMLLATWLVEIYLSKLDQLEDVAAAQAASQDVENYRLEQGLIDEELRQFLVTYTDSLDARTTFTLISRHGRTEIMLHYAAITGEYDRIVRHWLGEKEWAKAIDTISRQSDLSLYYRFSTVLMRNAPSQTVECWIRRPALEPRRLIPAMLQHRPGVGESNEAIRFLEHVIQAGQSTEPAVHNFLFTLLARGDKGQDAVEIDANLQHFIATSPSDPRTGDPYYDLDFALRTCAERKRQEASIRIYAKMGLHENAVDLALIEGDVHLACDCAELAEDQSLRRRLWLKTAKHVVETRKDIKAATEFLSLTPLLTIEDILPFFPDFTVIDSFKEEICLALEGYANKIEELKTEMENATESAKNIRSDIEQLSGRFVTVEEDDRCGLCDAEVTIRQFYVFPCRHSFHADCLIAETTRRLPPRSLRRLLELQTQLSRITSGLIPSLPPDYIEDSQGQSSQGVGISSLSTVPGYSLTRRAGASVAAAIASGSGSGSGGTGGSALGGTLGLDRLPETLLAVLTAGVSVSVAGGRRVLAPLDPFSEPVLGYRPRGSANGNGNGNGDLEDPSSSHFVATKVVNGTATASAAATATALTSNDSGGGAGGGMHGHTPTNHPHLFTRREREEIDTVQRLRDEMDSILAAACPLCEGSLADLAVPFVNGSNGGDSHAGVMGGVTNGAGGTTAFVGVGVGVNGETARIRELREEQEWAL